MTLYKAFFPERADRPELGRAADLAVIVAGSLLMTVAAKLTVPFYPVPLSMQTA